MKSTTSHINGFSRSNWSGSEREHQWQGIHSECGMRTFTIARNLEYQKAPSGMASGMDRGVPPEKMTVEHGGVLMH